MSFKDLFDGIYTSENGVLYFILIAVIVIGIIGIIRTIRKWKGEIRRLNNEWLVWVCWGVVYFYIMFKIPIESFDKVKDSFQKFGLSFGFGILAELDFVGIFYLLSIFIVVMFALLPPIYIVQYLGGWLR